MALTTHFGQYSSGSTGNILSTLSEVRVGDHRMAVAHHVVLDISDINIVYFFLALTVHSQNKGRRM